MTTLVRGAIAFALVTVGMAGLLVLALYELGTDAGPASHRLAFRRVEDAARGYRFELPAHWVTATNGGAQVYSGPPGAPDREVTINVQTTPLNPRSTPIGEAKELERQWGRLPGYHLRTPKRSTSLRGYAACSVRAAYSLPGQGTFVQEQWIVARKPHYYWIGYTAPEPLFDRNRHVLQRALDTLQLGTAGVTR